MMRWKRITWLVLMGTALAPCRAQTFALTHATAYVHPGDTALQDATLLITNGKIAACGLHVAVPVGTRTIDAKGRIVTPGLMNSGSQLGLVETGTPDTTDSAVASGPFGAAFDVKYGMNPNSTLLPVARADGLTRAMVLPTHSGTPPFDGLGAVLRLSEGPEILDRSDAAVVATIGGMVAPESGGSRSAQWMLIRMALTAAATRVAAPGHPQQTIGDASKLLNPVNLAALEPVLRRRIPLVIAASRESDLRQAIALVDDYKIHVVVIGAEEGWRVAGLLASHKIPVVLDPYASTPATYDQIGARLDNAAILDRAGVVISFKAAFVHVSYNAGIAIREGAGIAVANGLSWPHALRALTLNPAMTWGIDDHYGSLEPGKDADVVLWDGDPLEPSSAPVLVFVRGKQVSLETRQTALERRYRPALNSNPLPPGYH